MSQVVRFKLDDGGEVLVEPISEDGLIRASNNPGTALRNATVSFEAALGGVRDAAAATLRQFTSLPHQPEEVTIEFGVRLDLAAGAVIARTAIEGHLQVTLLWKRAERIESPSDRTEREEPRSPAASKATPSQVPSADGSAGHPAES